eukprot:511155-Rhodomonas_salina.2
MAATPPVVFSPRHAMSGADMNPFDASGAAMLGKNWTIERPLVMVGGNTSAPLSASALAV